MRQEEVGRCFYCDRPLTAIMRTIEHLVPQSALRRYRGRVPETFWRLNQVDACFKCNNAKGDTDPVEWALEQGPEIAARLAQRFREMGVPDDCIAVLPSGRSILNSVLEKAA